MTGFSKIRKANKDHRCTEHSWHEIKKGDHYLYCMAPPWHDMNSDGKYWVIKACLRCAETYGLHNSDTREQLKNLVGQKDQVVVGPILDDRIVVLTPKD